MTARTAEEIVAGWRAIEEPTFRKDITGADWDAYKRAAAATERRRADLIDEATKLDHAPALVVVGLAAAAPLLVRVLTCRSPAVPGLC